MGLFSFKSKEDDAASLEQKADALFEGAPAAEVPADDDFSKFSGSTFIPTPTEQAVMEATPDSADALFEGSETATLGEQATAIGRGVAGGAIRGTGISGGALAGAAVMAPVPIPGARIAGALIGAVGGYFLSDELVDVASDPDIMGDYTITYRSLDDVPPNLRPQAAFGETLGSFIGPSGAIVAIGKQGMRVLVNPSAGRLKTFAGNLINNILDTAATKTGRFVSTEAGASLTAAGAGATAVAIAPESGALRFGAEIVGGFFSPTRFVLGLGTDLSRTVVNFAKRQSPAMRQTKAGRLLQDYIEAAEGDPAAMVAFLREVQLPSGAKPTVAQVLGDPVAAAFEAEFREISREFGVQSASQARNALDAYAAAIFLMRDMAGEGAPAAFMEAARLQDQAFRAFLIMRMERAKNTALRAAEAITEDLPETRASISKAANSALDEAMRDGRSVERQLWARVKSVSRQPRRLFREYNKIRADMLPRDKLDEVVEGTISDMREAQELLNKAQKAGFDADQIIALEKTSRARNVPAAEREAAKATLDQLGISASQMKEAFGQMSTSHLAKFRSTTLEAARVADREGKDNLARRLGLLAEAALADTDGAFRAGIRNGSITKEIGQAYTHARRYTHAFHETFTRAFGGAIQQVGRRGELMLPPEVLLRRALVTGPEMRALRFDELEQATRFLPDMADKGFDVPKDVLRIARFNIDKMLDAQESFLRLAAAEVVDDTGAVSLKAIHEFQQNQAELIKRFSMVGDLLENAKTTESAKRLVENATKGQLARIAEENAFARILKVESAADAVGAALTHPRPIEQMSGLYEVAVKGGPEAVVGFRKAVFDHVASAARRLDGQGISLPALVKELDFPIKPGLPTLLDFAQTQQWMNVREVKIVRDLLDHARNVIRAQATSPTGELIFGGGVEDITGAGVDLLLRVVGAKGARLIAGPSAGESLIASYAGSRMLRQVFLRMPKLRLTQIVAGALRGDPLVPGGEPYGLAISLLEVPAAPKQAIKLAQQIHAYAIGASLTFTRDVLDDPVEEIEDDPSAAFFQGGAEQAPEPEPEENVGIPAGLGRPTGRLRENVRPLGELVVPSGEADQDVVQ